MDKIQYLGFYFLFLAYYFDHWPYFKENKIACRSIAYIFMSLSGICLASIITGGE